MSRPNLIALVGSIAVVLLLFWIVVLILSPGEPPRSIVGKWRPDQVSRCSDDVYTAISPTGMASKKAGEPEQKSRLKVAIAGDRGQQKILIRDPTHPQALNLVVTTEVKGDELRFLAADWSPEAHAAFPDLLKTAQFADLPAKALSQMQQNQPLHWCAD